MTEFSLAGCVAALADAFRDKPDDALDSPWAWGPHDEEGVRFGLLRSAEELRGLAERIVTARQAAGDAPTEAQRILAEHHRGFRQLEAVLLGVGGAHADRAPAEGEWSVRETLSHMAQTETGFHVSVTFGLRLFRSGNDPEAIPDEAWEETIGIPWTDLNATLRGPLPTVQEYFARAEARTLADFAGVTGRELDATCHFWEPEPMPIRHRLLRFDSHVRQHTLQVEKTLAALGETPGEASRLLRLVYDALGHAEAVALGARDSHERISEEVGSAIARRATELAEAMRSAGN